MKFIQAINSIHSNFLMLVVMGAGVWLTLHGQQGVGGNLIVGSFAILKTSTTQVPSTQVPDPNEQKKS